MRRRGGSPVQHAKAVAVACPACATADVGQAVSPYITSVVYGTDFVPFADLHSLDLMRQDVVASNWYAEWSRDMRNRNTAYRMVEGLLHAAANASAGMVSGVRDCAKALCMYANDAAAPPAPCMSTSQRCGMPVLVSEFMLIPEICMLRGQQCCSQDSRALDSRGNLC